MASNVTRDHHNLRRNLKLNGNYLSNDGGDEGLVVSDEGIVTASSRINIGNMALTSQELDVQGGSLILDVADDITLDAGGDNINLVGSAGTGLKFNQASSDWNIINTSSDKDIIFSAFDNSVATEVMRIDGSESSLLVASGKKIEFGAAEEYISGDGTDLTIVSGGKVFIDKDIDNTTGADLVALHVDFDRVGDVSSGGDIATGIDVEVDHTGASGGIISSVGMNIDVTGDSGGSSLGYGILIDLDGADTCTGLTVDVAAGTASTSNGIYIDNLNGGTDFKNISSANSADFFTINTIAAGNTTLTTVDTTVGATAHLNMVPDGNFKVDAAGFIILDSASGDVYFRDGGNNQLHLDMDGTVGEQILQLQITGDDLVFNQYDGNEVVRFTHEGDVKVTNTVYFAAETANTIADGGTDAIDWNVSQKQKLTITGTGITVNFTDPAGPCNLLLRVSQGDGSDVVGTWDADIKWAGGSAPTLSTGNGEIDILSFYWDGSKYYGVASLDFS